MIHGGGQQNDLGWSLPLSASSPLEFFYQCEIKISIPSFSGLWISSPLVTGLPTTQNNFQKLSLNPVLVKETLYKYVRAITADDNLHNEVPPTVSTRATVNHMEISHFSRQLGFNLHLLLCKSLK